MSFSGRYLITSIVRVHVIEVRLGIIFKIFRLLRIHVIWARFVSK